MIPVKAGALLFPLSTIMKQDSYECDRNSREVHGYPKGGVGWQSTDVDRCLYKK